jgi:hypothetical protein
MKSFRIGPTEIGRFQNARAAAVFHFATEAVIPFGLNQWMCVSTGELVRIVEA